VRVGIKAVPATRNSEREVASMKRSRIGGMLIGLAATLALATGVYATSPEPVTITVETGPTGVGDPFVTTGGILCAAGEVSNAGGHFVGWQNGAHAQILLVKHFECDEGAFDVLLRVTLDFATCDTVATWSVLDGTGAYNRLRGTGTLTGDSECGDTIIDSYVGAMHLD
jgi:hypothetical protein